MMNVNILFLSRNTSRSDRKDHNSNIFKHSGVECQSLDSECNTMWMVLDESPYIKTTIKRLCALNWPTSNHCQVWIVS